MKKKPMPAKHCAIRVCLSQSFDRKQKAIREIVLERLGSYESVLELGGCFVNGDRRDIIVTDGLIPRAKLSYASFTVTDLHLSACWAEAQRSPVLRHLKTVGDLHYHPEEESYSSYYGSCYRGPSPSGVDEENSLRQAGLYQIFNLQESLPEIREIALSRTDGKSGWRRYDIDRYSTILVGTPAGPDSADLRVVLTNQEKRAIWASLIATRSGNCLRATVVEHIFSHRYPKQAEVVLHDDVPVVVLPDEEVAGITGWPLERIAIPIESTALKAEVTEKYTVQGYGGWTNFDYGYGSHYGYSGSDYRQQQTRWIDAPSSPGGAASLHGAKKKAATCPALHSLVDPADVTQLLREAASLLDGSGDVSYRYLKAGASTAEIIVALKECARHLRGTLTGKRD